MRNMARAVWRVERRASARSVVAAATVARRRALAQWLLIARPFYFCHGGPLVRRLQFFLVDVNVNPTINWSSVT